VQPFLHDRLRRLDQLLEKNTALLVKHRDRDWDLGPAVEAFFGDAVASLKSLGLTAVENELASLMAQFHSAREGTHPFTLQPITTRRRTMERAVALHVLTAAGERLRSESGRGHQQLEDGRAQARALVLNALARGVLQPGDLPLVDAQAAEALWRRLLAHGELHLAARQLAMLLHAADITLLLFDLAGPS
jgi:hypothetical protein